ncbi:SUN domain-containing ossification factor-like [Trichomycterus rosablanca]|uniref:SUN domain-containing ossification factor-like n=1 Tax=Trichomycterus rosablanca TaxID=2290929 RepID=UPI002F34F327
MMKRLRCDITLFCVSAVLLCHWYPILHGYCSEQNELDLQNQPQTTPDIPMQQDGNKENESHDKDLHQNPIIDQTQDDTEPVEELHTQEAGQQQDNEKVDGTPEGEPTVPEHDSRSESSSASEQDADFQSASLLPPETVTASQPVLDSEDISLTSTDLPSSSTYSVGDDSCTSTSISGVSPTAACDAGENPSYDTDLTSLPIALENGSTHGTGKSTKAGINRGSKGTNASSMLKEQRVHGTTEPDPTPPSKDAEDIPTFDEWKKIMMEVENEKSQSTHTSSNGGSSAVKKVQKTTNYASVECGAKILSSNPEAKSTSAILMENVDVYMLNPCSNKIWFIIELCQPIQLKQLDIANFELFSSTPKDFLVSISDRYPTNKWAKLGTFHARDERTVQSFPLDEHLYAKYVKVELLSHFGSEHFCPLSLIRVFGTSMMEEYELNSEPSERLTSQDEDDDCPPGYVPTDDKSSKNLIGSAKDVIINMVNNIAANVLGGNPEGVDQTGGNSSFLDLNLTETTGTPVQSVSSTSSNIILESLEVEQHDVKTVTEMTSIPQDQDMDQTITLSKTPILEALSATPTVLESLSPSPIKEEQIVTLLPEEEGSGETDQSEQLFSSRPQDEEQGVNAQQDQQFDRVLENVKCRKDSTDSCSCLSSLQEYLLHRCFPPQVHQEKTRKTSQKSQSQPSTHFQQTNTLLPLMSSSFPVHALHTWTTDTPSSIEASVVVVPSLSEKFDAGYLELTPSLTSALATVTSTDSFASQATHALDFLDPSVVDLPVLKLHEKSKEKQPGAKRTPLPTCSLESPSNQESTTKSVERDHDQNTFPPVEKSSSERNSLTPSMTASTVEQATSTPLSPVTDQPLVQPDESETVAPSVALTATPVTEPLEAATVVVEPKAENLLEEASPGDNSNIQSALGNGQPVQTSTSDFYAEMQISSEAPIHGSNQKESVFMRLNNRIKALEVNMSLSGRYLEQLSQRYRKQMEEMQKAFNKTIIKLQNTSRIAEEQDQKQTESIQVLQKQLENVTQLVLNLSMRVSQLQTEVSDRHSCLLLCVVLSLLICIIIFAKFRRLSAVNSTPEPETSTPNIYSNFCPDRASCDYEDVNPKRRASYPFAQSSLQIAPTEGPNMAYDVETRRNSTENKKKKRCKMKTSRNPETITPTALSVSAVPNGHPSHSLNFRLPLCGTGPPFSPLRNPSSEESSEDSSQSDEPSFCGIAPCSRLCDTLSPPKCRPKKKGRLKKKSSVLKQLLQPVECKGPPVAPNFTLQGFFKGTTELRLSGPEVPLLSK